MKSVVMILTLLFSSASAFADDQHTGVRSQYDDLMKSSGKWEMISTGSFFLGVVAAGASYYAYSKYEGYMNLAKTKTLTPHEEDQERIWQDACNGAGIGSAALLVISVGAYIGEVHYENRAHAFALDMGVKF